MSIESSFLNLKDYCASITCSENNKNAIKIYYELVNGVQLNNYYEESIEYDKIKSKKNIDMNTIYGKIDVWNQLIGFVYGKRIKHAKQM